MTGHAHIPMSKERVLPLTPLDLAFARFLQERRPSPDERHIWLARLVSHQFGRGHACLDLRALQEDPGGLLGWDAQALAQLPIDLAPSVTTLPWLAGPGSPLLLVSDAHPPHAPWRLYLRRAWQAEQNILQALRTRLNQPVEPMPELHHRLDQLFAPQSKTPAPVWQKVACALATRHRLLLLSGGPGTGKTTTVSRLIALFQQQAVQGGAPLRIHLAAPTGKAAARLNESLHQAMQHLPPDFREVLQAHPPVEAQTLHRLLRLRPDGSTGPAEPLDTDLVVVDEASMIDLETMARLLDSVPLRAGLVLLGDQDQLASVEAGAVWAQLCQHARAGLYSQETLGWVRQHAGQDLSAWSASQDLFSQPVPPWAQCTVMLRHSRRFSAEGGIGRWAEAINQGQVDRVQTLWADCPAIGDKHGLDEHADVTRLAPPSMRTQAWKNLLRAAWAQWLAALPPLNSEAEVSDDQALHLLQAFGRMQVLCAVREGPWGVGQANQSAALALDLPPQGWYVGRPVMVTRNDRALGLMNGDIGLCLPHAQALRVAFPDGQGGVRWVSAARLDAVETVFAMTVHKSQGSEFDQVLCVLPDQPSPVLTRELLYTGLTRARCSLVWLVPDHGVLAMAVRTRVQRSGGIAADDGTILPVTQDPPFPSELHS